MAVEQTDYEKHLEVANDIQATRDESWRYVEKMHYTIASGALALSITLLTFTDALQFVWLIVASWILLVIAIILNFTSHLVSYKEADKTREEIFKRMSVGKEFVPAEINNIIGQHNCLIMWLNIISIITLIFGVICTLIFFIMQII